MLKWQLLLNSEQKFFQSLDFCFFSRGCRHYVFWPICLPCLSAISHEHLEWNYSTFLFGLKNERIRIWYSEIKGQGHCNMTHKLC